MSFRFHNRVDAGRALAARLENYAGRPDVLVLGLPRGGVVVAAEIAARLRVPLNVFLVRKLGVPRHEELALGAIASGGVSCLNHAVIESCGLRPAELDQIIAQEKVELSSRERLYRTHPLPCLAGKTLILTDDGLATGATMRASVAAAWQHQPAKIVAAVPVAAEDTLQQLRQEVDEAVNVGRRARSKSVSAIFRNCRATNPLPAALSLIRCGRRRAISEQT